VSGATGAAKATQAGRKADQSTFLDHAVRIGLVSYGVVHLLIAWLAFQLALGDKEGSASGSGALSQLAQQPFGAALLWVVAAGFLALVVWQGIEAATGHRDKDGSERTAKRAGSALKVVLYGTLCFSAVKIAAGSGSSGSGTDTMTAKLMSMPGGPILVGVVGVGVLAYAGRLIYRGLSEGFKKHLESRGQLGASGTAFITFGKVGYVSKGVALVPVAGLFFWAAASHDPQKSGGLDQALQKVLQQPFGAPVLIAIALGIACYGLFCFAWAWHLDR
jgi:hypothetical protein